MLEHTFIHLPGVGEKTESRLWERGFLHWDDVIGQEDPPFSRAKKGLALSALEESRKRLAQRDCDYFAQRLPAGEHWRLFPDFGDKVGYLDIETTGLGNGSGDHITTIALYDGQTVRTYVHGRNLEDFEDDIRECSLLVTFNGKCFDIPFIERQMRIKLPVAHIDLRFVLKALGMKGGLKSCEKQFGLDRDELDGVDGYFAVLLWQEFENTGNENVLETLLAYNAADVIGLEVLLHHALAAKFRDTPFGPDYPVSIPEPVANPHTPDVELVRQMKLLHYGL
ncbi:MAG: ribonuclease H-like domain-containing protein [Desulfovibrio sp.]|uniref:ribonuclease H-like domain-containing protein n=1 Tax=Desulfovibrio sp. 7SRBS1 TaxID=3378064 RepID=UPI003B3D875A